MDIQKKIEKWCRNERFVRYANERMSEELSEASNHWTDTEYEELAEAFEWDDRYALPLATYLTYRLQCAKLQKNAKQRRRAIWWVFVQVVMQGHYTQGFYTEFEKLQTALLETVMPMLHKEYIQWSNKKKR